MVPEREGRGGREGGKRIIDRWRNMAKGCYSRKWRDHIFNCKQKTERDLEVG